VTKQPFMIATLIAGCGGDGGAPLQEPGPIVATVIITAPTTMIRVEETVQLTATALDREGRVLEGQVFAWTSGIQTVATVSASGLVTGRVKGRSRIEATSEGVTDSIIISVAAARPPGPPE
jgi:uncharacterized protein YjdB